jgi:DNA-binding MarR family transcriptional regulator
MIGERRILAIGQGLSTHLIAVYLTSQQSVQKGAIMLSKPINAILALSALHTRVLKHVDRKLSAHGISLTEFMVMHRLSGAPAGTMRRIDLAEAVGLTASGITRLLNPMEKTHLIEKKSNERDARVSLVKLTEAGRTIYQQALTSFGYAADALCEPLSDRQLDQILEIMEKIK